jgi:hypothetical protein
LLKRKKEPRKALLEVEDWIKKKGSKWKQEKKVVVILNYR